MRKKKRIKKTIFLVMISLCFFIIAYRSSYIDSGSIEHFFSYVSYSFLKIQVSVLKRANDIAFQWSYMKKMEKDYTILLNERDDLRAEIIALKSIQDMQEETKELQEFAKHYQEKNYLARVLVKQYGSDGHFFLIEGGSDQGIKKDTAVVYKNCLVGKISQVYPWYSKVTLIIDPCCKVAAYCQKTKTVGIYQGESSLDKGSLCHVDHLSQVQEGDMVFTSGEGLIFPKGFGIGLIDSYIKNEEDMRYTIAIKPFIDFKSISYCFVLEKKSELV